MNEAALQARVEKIQREIDKREAALSTSERQARYISGRGRSEDVVDLRVVVQREREPAWGDDGERPELDGDRASRRQAARATRGASSRGGDSDA